MGAIANITQEGFGPSGFHAYPSTLEIDGYSGDYGPGFFGHAVNTGTYIARHPELGWLAFGGNWSVEGQTVRVTPLDSARSRVCVAPLGLWLTLDAGTFEQIEIDGDSVRVTLAPASASTPAARLRVEQPAAVAGVGAFEVVGSFERERGAHIIPLAGGSTRVELQQRNRPDR
jgi:hypothetical protein